MKLRIKLNYGATLLVAVSILVIAFISSVTEVEVSAASEMIKDADGRMINVSKPFKKIISLYGAHTENLFYLGLDTEIIGVTRNESFPEKAKLKPTFSAQDDPEKFMATGADLVLVRPMIERGYPDLIERLKKSGITVVSLQPGTVDEMYDYWIALGTLTGKKEAAAQMVATFRKKVEDYKKEATLIKNPKRVFFEAIHSKMKTFTPGSIALFALECAGGINIATEAEASRGTNIGNYGKEKILSHASEIDVYLAQRGVMNMTSEDMIRNEPGFEIIKAVRENQIHIIDEMIVSRPCFRLLDGIETIRGILYSR